VDTPELRRFALLVHYDGAPFQGWQSQSGVPTVQDALEAVVARLLAGRRVPVMGSGRTDSGVHATGQVASLVLPSPWTAPALQRSLNAMLPRSIWVEAVVPVAMDFHPRFHARRRSYRYQVGTSPQTHSPHLRRVCWPLRRPPLPDPELLHAAAAQLPGERSFRPFARAGQEHRGSRCRVFSARWEPWGSLGWSFHITADRYLHHMVRYLVGTQMAVARGERPLAEFEALLAAGDTPATGRPVTSPPAPPEGLFLTQVEYDPPLPFTSGLESITPIPEVEPRAPSDP
jgi:tRNA pseudouridine38-40 synthase